MDQQYDLNKSVLYFGTDTEQAKRLHEVILKICNKPVITVSDEEAMSGLIGRHCLKILDYQSTATWIRKQLAAVHSDWVQIVIINIDETPAYITDIIECFDTGASTTEVACYLDRLKHSHRMTIMQTALIFDLTAKERIVMGMIMEGLTNQQIANQLSRSVHTVKTHIYNLYQKLEVSSRAQAINKLMSHHNRLLRE